MIGSQHQPNIGVNLASLLKLQLAAKGLDVTGRQQQVMTTAAGAYFSGFKGRGSEFVEVRAYQPGDDIRTIDWRVTARTNRVYTKLYREERERPVFILVDYGPSMFFGTRVAFKSVIAAQTAALIAWSAAAGGDRVGGLVVNGERHIELQPGNGQRGVLPLLQILAKASEAMPLTIAPANTLTAALTRLQRLVRPGSLIFVISDFIGMDSAAIQACAQLATHNEMAAIFIYDPMEKQLPSASYYTFSDGQAKLTLASHDDWLHEQYKQHFEQRSHDLQQLFTKYGISWLSLSTEQEPLTVLRHYWPKQGKH